MLCCACLTASYPPPRLVLLLLTLAFVLLWLYHCLLIIFICCVIPFYRWRERAERRREPIDWSLCNTSASPPKKNERIKTDNIMNGNKWTTIWGHDVFSRNRFPYYFSAIFGEIPFQFLFFFIFLFLAHRFLTREFHDITSDARRFSPPPPPFQYYVSTIVSRRYFAVVVLSSGAPALRHSNRGQWRCWAE